MKKLVKSLPYLINGVLFTFLGLLLSTLILDTDPPVVLALRPVIPVLAFTAVGFCLLFSIGILLGKEHWVFNKEYLERHNK